MGRKKKLKSNLCDAIMVLESFAHCCDYNETKWTCYLRKEKPRIKLWMEKNTQKGLLHSCMLCVGIEFEEKNKVNIVVCLRHMQALLCVPMCITSWKGWKCCRHTNRLLSDLHHFRSIESAFDLIDMANNNQLTIGTDTNKQTRRHPKLKENTWKWRTVNTLSLPNTKSVTYFRGGHLKR